MSSPPWKGLYPVSNSNEGPPVMMSAWCADAVLPIAARELSVGVWLAVKGFSRATPVYASQAAGSGSGKLLPPA
jgi:type III secretory pathway component EscT